MIHVYPKMYFPLAWPNYCVLLSVCFRCVSAADDNLAIIWDIQLGYKLVVLLGHSRPITDMAVLPAKGEHSQQLLTGSSDKQIRVI